MGTSVEQIIRVCRNNQCNFKRTKSPLSRITFKQRRSEALNAVTVSVALHIQATVAAGEHFVYWNQTHSPLLNLNLGVLQGLILWPLLFLIYINDIVNSSNILSFVLFADATTVYVQHDSIDGAIQILNSELAKVAEWFDSNKLTLNVNKIHLLSSCLS